MSGLVCLIPYIRLTVSQPYRKECYEPIPVFLAIGKILRPPQLLTPARPVVYPFPLFPPPDGHTLCPQDFFYALWTTNGWAKLKAKPLQGLRASHPGVSGGSGEGVGGDGGGNIVGAGDGGSSR